LWFVSYGKVRLGVGGGVVGATKVPSNPGAVRQRGEKFELQVADVLVEVLEHCATIG